MRRYARLVADHPLWIVAVLAVVTLLALHGIVDLRTGRLRIEVDPAIDRLLPEGDEERRFYDRARQIFGNDEFILLVLEADDVFRPEVLGDVQRITRRIEDLDEVYRVVSLSNATQVEGREGELYVGPFYDTPPDDPAELARLREQVLDHPIYGGSLVSRDAHTTAILVFFDRVSDRDFVDRELSERVRQIAQEESRGLTVQVTGTPHIKLKLSRTIVGELRLILPAVSTIAAVLCVLAFRTARGAVLPLLAIAVALIWTVGLMGWTESPLNLVSNIVPPLIITLGFASTIHVVSEYYQVLREHPATDRASNAETVIRVLEDKGLTIAVNGLTTVIGFGSLTVSSVSAIREFGIWAVIGVIATTVTALTLMPALLVLLGPARRLPRGEQEGRLDVWAGRIGEFDVRNYRWILAGGVALLVLSLAGMSRIHVSTGFASNFMPRSQVRTDFESINEKLGGVSSFYVVLEADQDGAFTRPENLAVLRDLQEWLEAQPEIGGTASLADGVMLLNRAFQGNDPAAFSIPDRVRLVKQLLLFGGDEVTRGFVDGNYRVANVTARSRVSESSDVGKLMDRVQARLDELPHRLRGRVTGDVVLLNRTMDDIARGQIESITSALVMIYLTLAALLTSFRVGLFALLPNLLPIAVYYGTLGVTGIPLDLSTSLIGSITLGIAVDDTVHYFARFAQEARRVHDERRATVRTLQAEIRPVTFTAIGLCLGFLTLVTSELRNQVQFGVLSAFTILVGWFLELTLSPAICSRVRLVTLWHLLQTDLGRNPQTSIPLFHGLSGRQSRIFALMAQMVEMPAGRRLFSAGDKGNEMFVVIDGELAASLERGGQSVQLSSMKRGDVVGEIALFSEGRSADVDVVQEARLLRFGEADLERLGRRYPRIAAKVYRNLNRILAQRVQSTTRALR